jgi:hypothetical protein
MLPLWLGSCSLPAALSSEGTTAPAGGVPDPRPLPAPFPLTPSAGDTPTESAASAPAEKPRTGGSIAPQAGSNREGAATVGGGSGNLLPGSTASGSAGSGSSGESGSGSRTAPEATAGGQAALPGELPAGMHVYFVSLDDGGSTGVRFGCNDSLVAVFHSSAGTEDPLRTSLDILLGGGDPPDGLYNSLDDSTLQYVSAYFDGTTVVVNLTGTLRPGGTCDIPRLEAQLTHTAVSAVGASRAEIYVDGRRLADILSLR